MRALRATPPTAALSLALAALLWLPAPRDQERGQEEEPRDVAASYGQGEVWERVHRAIFERVATDGTRLGVGALDPLLFPASTWLLEAERAAELEASLAQLLADSRALERSPPLARALLQRDLWAVHDWLAQREVGQLGAERAARAEELRLGVARAHVRLSLDARELQVLEGALRAANAALPPDLAQLLESSRGEERGPWVRLAPGTGERLLAPQHAAHFGPRSAFSVHLRTPGGRGETLEYLERLGAAAHTVGEGAGLRLAPDLPQPPPGSAVALVRRALHLDRGGWLHVLPLVETIQLRTFPRSAPPWDAAESAQGAAGSPYGSAFWEPYQQVRELELDRAGLLAGRAPLREVGPGEPNLSSFGSHGWDPFEASPPLPLHPSLAGCNGCHGAPGIHSVIAFTGLLSGPGGHLEEPLRARPRAPVADAPGGSEARNRAAAAARGEFMRLLEARGARPSPGAGSGSGGR